MESWEHGGSCSLWSVGWKYLRERAITILYPSESSGMVPVKPWISKRWRDGHKSNSEKKNKTQQTQLRVWQRKSKPKGEDACVDFGAAGNKAVTKCVSCVWSPDIWIRWRAECGESRTLGAEWGKIRRWFQRITYHYPAQNLRAWSSSWLIKGNKKKGKAQSRRYQRQVTRINCDFTRLVL